MSSVHNIVQKYGFNHGCGNSREMDTAANTYNFVVNAAYIFDRDNSETFTRYSRDTVM